MGSAHSYTVAASTTKRVCEGGSRTSVTAAELPLLSGISFAQLGLDAGAAREPHWHPGVAELSYCTKGRAKMTIVEPGGSHESLLIESGDVVFVPSGYLHDVENLADGPTQLLIAFSDERPEDLDLSSSLGPMPDHVLAATFSQRTAFFDALRHPKESVFITKLGQPPEAPEAVASQYRFQLESLEPQVANDGGSARMCRGEDFEILDGLAVFSLVMVGKGVREPHWHPNAGELNYLAAGRARLTVVSPGGDVDTFDMELGDVSFIPRAYFHHIENLGDEDLHFVVFFSNAKPSDIGTSGALSAYSSDMLTALFGPADYDALPKRDADILVAPPAAD